MATLVSSTSGAIRKPTSQNEYPAVSEETMLMLFISTIGVRARLLEPLVETDSDKKGILGEIESALSAFREPLPQLHSGWSDAAWREAYRLERLIALVGPAENLQAELSARLDEASDENVPSIQRSRKAYETAILECVDTCQKPPALRASGEQRLRAQLIDVIEEIQWVQEKKYVARRL